MLFHPGANAPGSPENRSISRSRSRDNAMRKFDQAIQRNPTDAKAYAARAYEWLGNGNYDSAP